MSKIIVLASFYPKKDKNNEVKEIILSMINPTRSEEGNELYNFYEEKNNEDESASFHLFEIYKDSAALDFHRNTSHYKNYRSKIIAEVNALRNNSVDFYAAVRSSYYQNRKAAIKNVDKSELTPVPIISVEFE